MTERSGGPGAQWNLTLGQQTMHITEGKEQESKEESGSGPGMLTIALQHWEKEGPRSVRTGCTFLGSPSTEP